MKKNITENARLRVLMRMLRFFTTI
jgi:hypothetical protein